MVIKAAKNLTSAGPKFSEDKSRDGSAPPCKPLIVYFFGFFTSPVESSVIVFNAGVNNLNDVIKVAKKLMSAGPKFSDDKSRDGSGPPCKPLIVYSFWFSMLPL